MVSQLVIADNAEQLQPLTRGLPAFDAAAAQDDDARRNLLAAAADTFDPAGLYALEIERDAAWDLLDRTIPADWTISLVSSRRQYRYRSPLPAAGPVVTQWTALAFRDGKSELAVTGDTPTEAADKLLARFSNTPATPPAHAQADVAAMAERGMLEPLAPWSPSRAERINLGLVPA